MSSPDPGLFDNSADRALYALVLSGTCNLACPYCYFGDRTGPSMDRATADAVLDFVAARPAAGRELGFFGIEPMMAWDLLVWMVEEGERRMPDLRFGLNTNGTLFSPERLAFLAAHHIKITVSFDGEPEAHDANRPTKGGQRSSAQLGRHLPALLAYEPAVTARATLTPAHAARADRHLAAAFDVGFRNLSFSCDFTAAWCEADLDELRHAILRFGEAYAARLRRGEDVRVASLDSVGKGREVPEEGLYCGAGAHLLTIDVDGTLYPCWRFAADHAYPLGNVREGLTSPEQRRFLAFRTSAIESCAACRHAKACGRCIWVSEKMRGRWDAVTEAQCAFSMAMIEAGERLAGAMLAEANPVYCGRLARRTGKAVPLPDGRLYVVTPDGTHYCLPAELLTSRP